MSARQRKEARKRAYERGQLARESGFPASANPYKPLGSHRHPGGSRHGEWSLYPAWFCGWNAAPERQSANTQGNRSEPEG